MASYFYEAWIQFLSSEEIDFHRHLSYTTKLPIELYNKKQKQLAKWPLPADEHRISKYDKQFICYVYYYYITPFNGLFARTTWVSLYQKGKTSLDLNEARDDGVFGCSGISWTICKQSAPRCRQITTPTRHCSFFTGQMLFLTPNQQCQSRFCFTDIIIMQITYTHKHFPASIEINLN